METRRKWSNNNSQHGGIRLKYSGLSNIVKNVDIGQTYFHGYAETVAYQDTEGMPTSDDQIIITA